MADVRNVFVNFGDYCLKIDHLYLRPGKITWLRGKSGSGKTTLLRILCGLESGGKDFSWVVEGEDLSRLSPEERRLGVVFQDYRLFPHLTAQENIDLGWQARGLPKSESIDFRDKLVFELRLSQCLRTRASVLSGGEQQRVALARALVSKPRLLLLDEPFSALDEDVAEESRQLLKKLVDQFELTTLLVSHHSADGWLADEEFSL